jgi:hypothetical protein
MVYYNATYSYNDIVGHDDNKKMMIVTAKIICQPNGTFLLSVGLNR